MSSILSFLWLFLFKLLDVWPKMQSGCLIVHAQPVKNVMMENTGKLVSVFEKEQTSGGYQYKDGAIYFKKKQSHRRFTSGGHELHQDKNYPNERDINRDFDTVTSTVEAVINEEMMNGKEYKAYDLATNDNIKSNYTVKNRLIKADEEKVQNGISLQSHDLAMDEGNGGQPTIYSSLYNIQAAIDGPIKHENIDVDINSIGRISRHLMSIKDISQTLRPPPLQTVKMSIEDITQTPRPQPLQTVKDLAVCLTKKCRNLVSPKSCAGKCNSLETNACSCRPSCLLFNRCCGDFQLVCPTEYFDAYTNIARYPEIETECDSFLEHLVVSSCPKMASEREHKKCNQQRDPNILNSMIPVIDVETRWHFKNIYCWNCWNVSANYKPWLARIIIPEDKRSENLSSNALQIASDHPTWVTWYLSLEELMYKCGSWQNNTTNLCAKLLIDHPDLVAMCQPRNSSHVSSSCQGRCNSTGTFPCSCMPQCIIHETCCDDFPRFCRGNFIEARDYSIQYPELTTVCDDIIRVSVISHCPTSASVNEIKQCESRDPFFAKSFSPVTDSITNWQFKSKFCWQCWKMEGKPITWTARAHKDAIGYIPKESGLSHTLVYILENHEFVYWFPEMQLPRHSCSRSKVTCLMRKFYHILPIPLYCSNINTNSSESSDFFSSITASGISDCVDCVNKSDGHHNESSSCTGCNFTNASLPVSLANCSSCKGLYLNPFGINYVCHYDNDINRYTVNVCQDNSSLFRASCESTSEWYGDIQIPVVDVSSGIYFKNIYCWRCWNSSSQAIPLSASVFVEESFIPALLQDSMESVLMYMLNNSERVIWKSSNDVIYQSCKNVSDLLNRTECRYCLHDHNCSSSVLSSSENLAIKMRDNLPCSVCNHESKCKQIDLSHLSLKATESRLIEIHVSMKGEGTNSSLLFKTSYVPMDFSVKLPWGKQECDNLARNCKAIECNEVGFLINGKCVQVQRFSLLVTTCENGNTVFNECISTQNEVWNNFPMEDENDTISGNIEENNNDKIWLENSFLMNKESKDISGSIALMANATELKVPRMWKHKLFNIITTTAELTTAIRMFRHQETGAISTLLFFVSWHNMSMPTVYNKVKGAFVDMFNSYDDSCDKRSHVYVTLRSDVRPVHAVGLSLPAQSGLDFVHQTCRQMLTFPLINHQNSNNVSAVYESSSTVSKTSTLIIVFSVVNTLLKVAPSFLV